MYNLVAQPFRFSVQGSLLKFCFIRNIKSILFKDIINKSLKTHIGILCIVFLINNQSQTLNTVSKHYKTIYTVTHGKKINYHSKYKI